MIAVLAVVQLVIKLAPLLVLLAVAVVVAKAVQARRRPPPPLMPALPPARRVTPAVTAPPRPVGWAPQAPGGWVLLPVWMGPAPVAWRPPPTVIDADVEGEHRG